MPCNVGSTIRVSSACMPSGSVNQMLWNAPRSSTAPSVAPRATSRSRNVSKCSDDAAPSATWSRCPRWNIAGSAVPCSVLGDLGGMDPRVRAGAQDGVAERRRRLAEDDVELEDVAIELDEAVEVGGEDGNVVDAGQHGHREAPSSMMIGRRRRRRSGVCASARAPAGAWSAAATVSAASAPSMSQ